MALKGDTTGLDTLLWGGEPWIPLLSGFSGSRRTGVRQSTFEGGKTRQRKKFYNQPRVKEATFYAESQAQQDYFMSFSERNEGKPFICHLHGSRPIVEPCVVQVISDWEEDLTSSIDGEFTVTLEITHVRDQCLDDFLFPMYQCVGDDIYCVLSGIVELALKAPKV